MVGKSSRLVTKAKAHSVGAKATKGGTSARSKPSDIARQARRHTAAALGAFVSVMQDASAPAAARVAAATQILTWAHGKASADGEDMPKTVRLAWEG